MGRMVVILVMTVTISIFASPCNASTGSPYALQELLDRYCSIPQYSSQSEAIAYLRNLDLSQVTPSEAQLFGQMIANQIEIIETDAQRSGTLMRAAKTIFAAIVAFGMGLEGEIPDEDTFSWLANKREKDDGFMYKLNNIINSYNGSVKFPSFCNRGF